MTKGDFQSEVRRISSTNSMWINISTHASDRMSERSINFRQVIRCLSEGTATKNPKFSSDHQSWEGEMQVQSSGEMVTVVCAIVEDQYGKTVTVITVK